MTKGLSFAVPYDPQSMFVIIITIIIKNWSCKAGERERKTYLELLLKDEDDGDGGVANQCYFLPLYFCFSFTSPLFLLFSACFLFFFFVSLVPPVSFCSCSTWSLSVLSVFVYFSSVFFCIMCLWFSHPLWLCLFVLISLGMYLVGWINKLRWGEVEVPFCWRKVTSLSVFSLSLFFFPPASSSLCVVVFIGHENAPSSLPG